MNDLYAFTDPESIVDFLNSLNPEKRIFESERYTRTVKKNPILGLFNDDLQPERQWKIVLNQSHDVALFHPFDPSGPVGEIHIEVGKVRGAPGDYETIELRLEKEITYKGGIIPGKAVAGVMVYDDRSTDNLLVIPRYEVRDGQVKTDALSALLPKEMFLKPAYRR